ncbi:MAG: hypothetical protein K2W95_25790 [Candidatus Obscuribacterales bacterium]|nr:hypothetical protein [Candidatus Obscuribacterales bacterium]
MYWLFACTRGSGGGSAVKRATISVPELGRQTRLTSGGAAPVKLRNGENQSKVRKDSCQNELLTKQKADLSAAATMK